MRKIGKIGNVKNFLKSLYYANKPLRTAKDPLSHIDIKVKDEYIGDMVRENISSFADYAKMHGLKVKIAQKGNSLLINSGVYTDVLPLKEKTAVDVYKNILDNLQKNASAKKI